MVVTGVPLGQGDEIVQLDRVEQKGASVKRASHSPPEEA